MALNLKQLKTLLHTPPDHNIKVTVDEPQPGPQPEPEHEPVVNAEYFPFADLKDLKDTAAELNEYFKAATFKPSKVDYKKMAEGALLNIKKYWNDKKYVIARVSDLKVIREKYCNH